ncbi:MAG: hypothetical protein H0S81_04450, partial [Desulfotignum balticum]|nr:hypothetical protein [Desulfotignum balticum]
MNTKSLADGFDNAVETAVEAVSITFDTLFNQISDVIDLTLTGIEQIFLFPPFYLF